MVVPARLVGPAPASLASRAGSPVGRKRGSSSGRRRFQRQARRRRQCTGSYWRTETSVGAGEARWSFLAAFDEVALEPQPQRIVPHKFEGKPASAVQKDANAKTAAKIRRITAGGLLRCV